MTGFGRYCRRVASSGLCGPIAILLMAVALLFNLTTTSVTGVPEGAYGPLSWPLFALTLLAAGIALLCAIRARGFLVNSLAPPPPKPRQLAESGNTRVMVAAGLIALYAVGFVYIGFLLSTIVFLALWLVFARFSGVLRVALISLLGTILPMYLLIKVAYTPLPRGVGVFEQATVQLYQWLGLF